MNGSTRPTVIPPRSRGRLGMTRLSTLGSWNPAAARATCRNARAGSSNRHTRRSWRSRSPRRGPRHRLDVIAPNGAPCPAGADAGTLLIAVLQSRVRPELQRALDEAERSRPLHDVAVRTAPRQPELVDGERARLERLLLRARLEPGVLEESFRGSVEPDALRPKRLTQRRPSQPTGANELRKGRAHARDALLTFAGRERGDGAVRASAFERVRNQSAMPGM